MTAPIKDSDKSHWVNRAPLSLRPYLQLSRLDRPVGYWLLALPGWIGLAFATLSHGFAVTDLKWAALILIGAIAMRGAGCTYNDIVDQDLDRQVERTALRPLPAGTMTTRQAWIWLLAQCGVGLLVLLCLPRLAQIIALCSIPLVAAYPFMKRITWWPQLWLGLTFNWAVLVAYAAKTGAVLQVFVLYIGLVFWTIGYDTIYACQDIEDDALIGVKSTARRFGKHIKWGVAIFYGLFSFCLLIAMYIEPFGKTSTFEFLFLNRDQLLWLYPLSIIIILMPAFILMGIITRQFDSRDGRACLQLFKRNFWVAMLLIVGMYLWTPLMGLITTYLIH